MLMKKDGITQEVFSPIDIARLKQAGYVEVKDAPVPVETPPVAVPEPEPESKPDQQAKDQATVEEVLQPAKKKRAVKDA